MFLVVSTFTFSQTVYKVEPGTKGNKIILTIENTSASLSVNTLEIMETNQSEFIDIKDNAITVSNITKGSEKDVEIEFDILIEAPINIKDSLNFVLTNGNGNSWSKKIILEYTPPKSYALFQNYPNPFNPTTTIRYSIPSVETRRGVSPLVTLNIYDILGREVATLVNKEQKPGSYEVVFNASNLTSGVYFARLSTESFKKTISMLLIK